MELLRVLVLVLLKLLVVLIVGHLILLKDLDLGHESLESLILVLDKLGKDLLIVFSSLSHLIKLLSESSNLPLVLSLLLLKQLVRFLPSLQLRYVHAPTEAVYFHLMVLTNHGS